MGITFQYKVCQFFLFARFYYMKQTILLKKYAREVKQFVFTIPQIETKPKCLSTSNANVQYNSISEHD